MHDWFFFGVSLQCCAFRSRSLGRLLLTFRGRDLAFQTHKALCSVGWCIQGEFVSETKKKWIISGKQFCFKDRKLYVLSQVDFLTWYLSARRRNERGGMNKMWQGLLSHILLKKLVCLCTCQGSVQDDGKFGLSKWHKLNKLLKNVSKLAKYYKLRRKANLPV